jgi:hypothetical protein
VCQQAERSGIDHVTDGLRRALRYVPGVAMAGYAAAGLFTLLVTAPLLPDDLAILVRAARRAVAGQDPYRPAGIGEAFVYPPTALPLLAPLACLPDWLVAPLWRTASAALSGCAFAALLASARRGMRAASPRSLPAPDAAGGVRQREAEVGPAADASKAWAVGRAPAVLLASACLYAPALEDVRVGQSNAIVLLGLALFATRGAPTARWLADCGLAAAIPFKRTPALLLIVPLVRREPGVVARVAAALFGLVAVSALIGGRGLWPSYAAALHDLAAGEASGANLAAGALLARAGLAGSMAGGLGGATIPAVVAASCLCLAACARARDWPSLAGVMVCGAVLASPVVWYHRLTWAGRAACGARRRPCGGGWPRRRAVVALALIQADRPFEVLGGLPPVLAACGAWLMLVAASLGLRDREGTPLPSIRPGEAGNSGAYGRAGLEGTRRSATRS